MSDDNITIRRAETIMVPQACQEAKRRPEESPTIATSSRSPRWSGPALLAGSFWVRSPSPGEALGLSFAFLGKLEGRLCLYSQLTGVVPGQQGKGLGGRLKSVQRDFARAEGLDCLAWAFDPLQSGNARFNLDRLGATASRFVEDMYGRRTDALNANATTDRLIAEWSTGPVDRPGIAGEVAHLPRLIDVREQWLTRNGRNPTGPDLEGADREISGSDIPSVAKE